MSAEDRAKYQKDSELNENLDLKFLFYNDSPIAKNIPPPSGCGRNGTVSNTQ